MGNSNNPFGVDSAPESNPFQRPPRAAATATPKKPDESKEKAGQNPKTTIQDLEHKAEIVKADPTAQAAEAIRQIDGAKATTSQEEGIKAFSTAFSNILDKLKAKGVDTSKIQSPADLRQEVSRAGIPLALSERAVMENFDRIMKAKGPTTERLRELLPKPLDKEQAAVKAIDALKGDKETAEQLEGIIAFDAAVVNLLAKLNKAHYPKKIKDANDLKKAVKDTLIETTPSEKAVLRNLNRILSEKGPTADHIYENWPQRAEAAKEAAKGWKSKLWNYVQKKPAASFGMLLLGAGALGLAYFGTSALYKKIMAPKDADKSKEGNDGSILAKKEFWAVIGLLALGGILGKDAIKRLLADVGLNFDEVEDKVKKGEEFTKEEKAKMEEAAKKAKEEANKARAGISGYAGSEVADKTKETEEKAEEAVTEAAEKADKTLPYETPKTILIRAFCFDEFIYTETDVSNIDKAIDTLSDKKISEVQALWMAHKTDEELGEIPHKTDLVTFPEHIKEANIYTAVRILALTTEEYQKRLPNVDFSNLTVREFFEKHVHNDTVSRVQVAVQDAIIDGVKAASLTDLSNLKNLDLSGIEKAIESVGHGIWDSLCAEYQIDLNELNRPHFVAIMTYLYEKATLQEDAEEALEHFDTADYDPKAVEAAKKLYNAICDKTRKTIIPAAVQRFNLDKDMINNPDNTENADIIKRKLNDDILFKRAVHLNLVTKAIDLNKSPAEGSSPPQELAFLFTVLNSIPDKKYQDRYISELAILMIRSSKKVKLPSLELIRPYFKLVGKFALKHVAHKVKAAGYLASAIMKKRSIEDRAKYLERMQHADWIEWGGEMALEGTGGAIQVAWNFIEPFVESGAITLDELGDCEDAWDFMLLVKKAGGTFLYSRGENGEPQGMIYFAGDVFLFRPLGIIKETFDAALDGDVEGGFKVWTVGSAPFVAFGAMHGGLMAYWGKGGWQTGRQIWGAMKGAGKGFAYPYYALRTTKRMTERTVKAGVHAYQATREMAGRPGYTLRHGLREASEIMRHGSIKQGVANLMEDGGRFMEYKRITDLSDMKVSGWLEYLKNDKASLVKSLAGDYNTKMAARYAQRYVEQYNEFFGFLSKSDTGFLRLAEDASNLDAISKTYLNLKRFMEEVDKADDVLEEILRLGKTLKGATLHERILAELRKIRGLDAHEYEALAEQLTDQSKVESFVRRLRDGVKAGKDAQKAGRAGLGSRLYERLRPSTEAEATRSFGKSKEALMAAEKDLASVQKRIATARADISLVQRMRKGPMLEAQAKAYQKRLDDARKIVRDGEMAEAELQKSVAALRRVAEVEQKLADVTKVASPEGAKLAAELRAAETAAEDALRTSNKAVEGIGRLGRLGTTAKWAGRGLAAVGFGFSAFEAVSSGYEAATTDVEGRGAIKGAEAGMWTVSAIADGAALAVMFGAEGAAVSYASAAAAPLVPLTYAGATVAETLYEETKTDYEWAQEGNPYDMLYHFYTSVNSISLGDAWVTVGVESQIERSKKAKVETMHKIYRGLVAIQKDPSLLDYIQKTPSSDEKNHEVERRIEANYSIYHEFYFRNLQPSNMQSYGHAQEAILEAQMFDDIMKERDERKAKKQPFALTGNDKRPYNLHLDRYDVLGGMGEPHGRINYNPAHIVQAYKESMLRVFESDAVLKANLERMDSAYLIRLYVQICRALDKDSPQKAEIDAEDGLRDELVKQASGISAYLKCSRNVNMIFAMGDPEYREPVMSLDRIKEHLEGMGSVENKAFLQFEKEHYKLTPGIHAVYRLAEYFGYSGPPTEARLKAFFNEKTGSYHGLYWDGDEWVLQERGWESDDEMGSELTDDLVQKVIARMREQPDNILEHRSDTVFLDAYDYSAEVKRMAGILEAGLKEGRERQKEVAPGRLAA